jgi:hypothetical protein
MHTRLVALPLIFVCAVCGPIAAAELELPIREQGVLNGANYTIQIPEDWNGGLVLFAHGYLVSEAQRSYHLPYIDLPFTDDVDPESGDPASHRMMAAALERGFATARHRYSRVGYMMQEGTLETEMLRHYFESTYGATWPTIITGNHGGGTITINLLEKFPESYDGGIALTPLSAPALDSLKERVFDMRLVFDWMFPPGLPGSVVDFSEPVNAAENIPKLLAAHPDRVPVFMRMFDFENERELAFTLGFYCHVLRELAVDRGLGNAFDNTNTLYTGSDDDATLNREIPRYTADPRAVEYLTRWATFTGELSDPLIVVSALEDPIVHAEVTRDYDNLTRRRGTPHDYVQMWVPHDRAWYTSDQIRQALDMLLAWIEHGTRPTPGELEQQTAPAP